MRVRDLVSVLIFLASLLPAQCLAAPAVISRNPACRDGYLVRLVGGNQKHRLRVEYPAGVEVMASGPFLTVTPTLVSRAKVYEFAQFNTDEARRQERPDALVYGVGLAVTKAANAALSSALGGERTTDVVLSCGPKNWNGQVYWHGRKLELTVWLPGPLSDAKAFAKSLTTSIEIRSQGGS